MPTDEGTAERKERPMDVRPPLVADLEAAEAIEPREGAFDDPAMAAEPLAGLTASAGDARGNATLTAGGATVREIEAFVGVQLLGAATRPSTLPAVLGRSVDRLHRDGRRQTG